MGSFATAATEHMVVVRRPRLLSRRRSVSARYIGIGLTADNSEVVRGVGLAFDTRWFACRHRREGDRRAPKSWK